MTLRLRDLAKEYFRFLPVLLSYKADAEPLQHPIFTFGELKEVVAAFQKSQQMKDESSERTRP